ncbi:MAG TPA: ABC transporter permease [Vicinamibacterales bacterium]|nr:ABC transporter permease [Vicinamibacterales bacterium]
MGWVRRLQATFSGTGDDFDQERRFHIDERTDEYVRRGMGREEARRVALERFGNSSLAMERTEDADMFRWLHDLGRDTRYALRMLRRSPGFSLLAIVCLTLGIGANAAVFSWIEGILLRPYPLVADQDRLFAVTGTNRGAPGNSDVSWPDWLDLQRNSTLVEAFIGEKITGTTLSTGDRAERASGSMVSANYFDAIGVRPLLGRGFERGEDSGRNAHPVTVISYQMWQDRFHGDPSIVGKTQVLAGLPHTIVGVAPKGFYGTFVGYAFQFWVPASMQSQFDAGVYKLEDRGSRWIEGYVRLKPGVAIEQAQAELSAIAARLEADYPETNRGRGLRLFPLWQTPFNNAGALLPTLGTALVVVVSVLLIACANVGNLLLVRAFARQQELTIRLSVGAGRSRLVKQLLTEGLILSAIAAAGGLVVANWLRDAVALLTPPRGGVLLRLPGELDWRVLALSAGVCVVSTLLFALVPAMLTSNIDLAGALRSQSGGVVGSRSRAWVRSALVLVQMSLSFVLLVGAGLLIQSLQAVRNASPGFLTQGVLTTGVDLFTAGYDPQRAKTFQDELIDRVQAMGGVESAALSRITPFSYRTYSTASIAVDGYAAPPDQQPTANYNEIGPGFLATMGIPLVAGREFTRADNEAAPLAAVVDETMAAQFWGGADPVGRRVQVKGRWMQIVGVARNAKYGNLLETPRPFFYVALRQNYSAATALQIRTAQGPAALAPSLVREIHALDANVAPSELITMREQVERTTAPQRISVTILVVFGGLAVVLAAIGLYGVMAATVSQSSRELALRMALGASASDLLGLVLSKGLVLTAGGLVLGFIAALQATRLLGYLLYKVSPRDPIAFGAAFGVIVVAALVACFVPAWRATRTDPLGALRG